MAHSDVFTSPEKLFFTYLVLAQSDEHIEEDEVKQVNEFVLEITKQSITPEQAQKIKELLNNCSASEKKEIIKDFVINDSLISENKDIFIQGLEEIIIADLDVDSNEMEMFRFIKHLLN